MNDGVWRIAPVDEAGADWKRAADTGARPLGVAWPERNNMTWRRIQILGFIADYTEAHGYPPSLREVGKAVGYAASPSPVLRMVGQLEARGLLELPRQAGQPRSLRLVRPGEVA